MLIILWIHLAGLCVFGDDGKQVQEKVASEPKEQAVDQKRLSLELELDAYYSSLDLIASLTDKPIPDVGEKSEFEIYKDLLLSSYLPRFLLLEASVNPMPCLGVLIKENAQDFYEDAEVADGINLVRVVTAGFEEPYALSMFLGNVVVCECNSAEGIHLA